MTDETLYNYMANFRSLKMTKNYIKTFKLFKQYNIILKSFLQNLKPEI